MNKEKILELIRELKNSSHYIYPIFSYGSCFRLYKILKILFPKAKPYYSDIDGHWITKIGDIFYDIGGEIDKKYVEDKKYELITDKTTLASAYIPTYEGEGVSYSKYIKSV